ncbi:MAG: Eco57I restriction-modification methylase domain-containing protein [Alphaproteobacteria bacterium]|nr:Eco57I restriction-modification methylase domain-containing protein [Alphaproteobacteria bacterium]
MINKKAVLDLLAQNKLKELFTQYLGWNNFNQTMPITIDGTKYILNGLVEKEGFAIYEYCNTDTIPLKYDIRKKISNKLSKTQLEHMIVFTERNEQIWQWIKRATKDSPAATRSEVYSPKNQSGEKLYQKLEKLFFGWGDYTISDVTQRVNESLNKDKVTKKFYEEFKKNKDNFSKFIEGMKETVDKEWYSSLMLNRLMFIYFIQKKGFLNNDLNYMRTKLDEIQEKRGNNKFYTFYREFLLVLFHKGFAKELNKRSAETMQIIGKIPYLNGGLFDIHELERKYPDITIPDSAFEKIFDFFDKYDWHLDDRPVSDDRQINPDVIGHIFEKYINQKQMGAYYTKEDITEYISKNTIIPYLFEAAKKKCEVAFKSDSYIWQMLKDNPDKYIYDAVKKGCDKELPESIAKGVDDVSKREGWNTPASEEYALPTEIWRETVERRNRYFDIKSKLENGEINSINDFITYNLDIRQFAEDIITNAESPDVVKAFYYTIAGHIAEKSNEKDVPAMSILDPTCGSGAFLFAGLNILEPLYDACIDKMYAFKHEKPDSYKEFDSVLENIEQHPNREYFIYKSIILNNLYGVDIMKEATEIAKLRLFLKLASCAEVDYRKENYGLEALPDIDFNIRAGNSLVGFANYQSVRDAVNHANDDQASFLFDDPMPKIDEKAQIVAQAYKRFKDTQTVSGTHDDIVAAKQDLQQRLSALNDELNHYMAKEYGIDTNKEDCYKQWLSTHEPFNWFVEFYDVIHNRGGFDIIIGNPPYVEYNDKIKQFYTIKNYTTEECGNLHAFTLEKSCKIKSNQGFLGFIVPLAIISTPRMSTAIYLINNYSSFISSYECRPGKLFEGADIRVSIIILTPRNEYKSKHNTTNLQKFCTEERDILFKKLQYQSLENIKKEYLLIPKLKSNIEVSIYNKLYSQKNKICNYVAENGSNNKLYYSYGYRYWAKVLNESTEFEGTNATRSTGEKELPLLDNMDKNQIIASLSSSLFYWYYVVTSDAHNFTKHIIYNFPIDLTGLEGLKSINGRYQEDLYKNSIYKTVVYKSTGEIKYREYYVRKSKLFIDEIDKVLAKHYGFTDEELDYIINYDIKYRMGDSLNGDGDEE